MSTPCFFQYLFCEVTTQNMVSFIAIKYQSPSQAADTFNNLQLNLEKLLNKIKHLNLFFTAILS